MAWRLAKSLTTMRGELDDKFPGRSKASDGSIGDAAHASRTSDHNPNSRGVVCAIDVTTQGQDEVGDAIVTAAWKDRRVKYMIWKGRIVSSTTSPWVWRNYSGSNQHNHHLHISVGGNYDSATPWGIAAPAPPEPPYPGPRGTLGVFPLEGGDRSEHFFGIESTDPLQHSGYWESDQPRIKALQARLGVPETGRYDQRTRQGVMWWQKRLGLTVDGFAGPVTWRNL